MKVLALEEICKKNISKYSFDDYDLGAFSKKLALFEHNQLAVKNALVALWEFQKNRDALLSQYMVLKSSVEDNSFDFGENDLNRASFWMATGAGKTIVLLKLVEVMALAMKKKQIQKKKMLLLAPTDQILNQFKKLCDEYNIEHSSKIRLLELSSYQSFDAQLDFGDIILYYARSDLIDVEAHTSKSNDGKRLDYKDYLEKNGWYVFLDEAHKGVDRHSTRKSYYQELAANGFIFNFSATFSDYIDIFTCAYNYNLQKFNSDGYGKLIAVLDDELSNFRTEKDFSDEAKQKLILKSFILFAVLKKAYFALSNIDQNLYHNPLMVSVCDRVNTIDAGLKLYFKTVLNILKNNVDITDLKLEVIHNLQDKNYQFVTQKVSPEFIDLIKDISVDEIRKFVFHAPQKSNCEAYIMKGNVHEIAFKSRGADKPFLLLNVGDNSDWKKNIIEELGIDVIEEVKNSYFANIEDRNSPINIMLGSRVFVEGWDCNRVNFINFINIGGANAVKYVLQTIGRGIRIEPLKSFRKRFSFFKNSPFSLEKDAKIKKFAPILETLFVFATHKRAVEDIIRGLEQNKTEVSLFIKGIKKNSQLFGPLFVPDYENSCHKEKLKYTISDNEYSKLVSFINHCSRDVLLLELSGISNSGDFCLHTIERILEPSNFIFNNLSAEPLEELTLIKKIDLFFNSRLEKLKGYKLIDDEINHYKFISSNCLNETEIEKINRDLKNFIAGSQCSEHELDALFDAGSISREEYKAALKNIGKSDVHNEYVQFKNIAQHFYTPLLIENKGKEGYIRHIVREESEIEFLMDLENYLKQSDARLNKIEWAFSKIVENVDGIYIPYIDFSVSKVRKFFPDFIFWLKDEDGYRIVFVDPKGLNAPNNAIYKKDGFEAVFHDKIDNVKVSLVYYNKNNVPISDLDGYVVGSIAGIFENI